MAYYPRIRDLREDSDKAQKEAAEYLSTPYRYYAVYEKGTSEISFERAILLAKYSIRGLAPSFNEANVQWELELPLSIKWNPSPN